MRFSIMLKLVLIFVAVIIVPVAVITSLSLWINISRLETDLQAGSTKALNNAKNMLTEHIQRAENIAQLLSVTSEIKENLRGEETRAAEIQQTLDDKQEMWFTAIVEVFDNEKKFMARSFTQGEDLTPFFTHSEDPIISATLDNLEKQSDYFVSRNQLSIKAAMPIINSETLETLGTVIVTFPFNAYLLKTIKERIQAEVTLMLISESVLEAGTPMMTDSGNIVSTIQDEKGASLASSLKSSVFRDSVKTDLMKEKTVRQQEHIGPNYYATTYSVLKNSDKKAVGILMTAVDSVAIERSKKDTLRLILMSSLAIFAFAVFMAYLTARSFTRPIYKLATAIRSMAEGNLEERVSVRQNDEIGDLAKAFNHMTAQLLEKQRALREKQQALEKAEEKYRGIFENAVEGIFQTEPEGRFISANPALAKILGYASLDTLFSSDANLIQQHSSVTPEDREKFMTILDQNDVVMGFETQILQKDGTVRWVSVSARSVSGTDGNLMYYEGSMNDITERKEKETAEKEKEIAEAANKKIMDSIRYAKMIQSSLLPNPENIRNFLPESFFIWMPRDIVGGDFIFTDCFEEGLILAVIDCTGHGVPGAFMTIISAFGLRKIIRDEGCRDPGQILGRLSFLVKTTLHQDTDYAVSDDGLDAAICFISFAEKTITYSGAKLPLIYIRNDELTLVKGDKSSLGYRKSDFNIKFVNHTLPFEKGTAFYLYSDGYVDQLGGEKESRFGTPRLKELLLKNRHLPFEKQKDLCLLAFNEWQNCGQNERQDDVTLLGFSA